MAKDAQHLGRTAGAVDAEDVGARVSQFGGGTGGRVAQQGEVVAGEGHRGGHRHGSAADGFGGAHGFGGLVQVAHRFDDDEVCAAVDEGGDLLAEGSIGLLGAHAAKGGQPHAQRPHRPGDEHRFEGCFDHAAGQLHGGGVDLGHLRFEAVLGQLEAVGAEGVRFDDLRARVNVSPMDFGHRGGLSKVEFVEALVEGDAARVQHGAHGAIGQEGRRGKAGEKVGGHRGQVYRIRRGGASNKKSARR